MLKNCYTLASVVTLGGMVFGGMTWAVGCSSTDPASSTTPDGADTGTGGTKDSGPGGDDSGNPGDKDGGGDKDTGGPAPGVKITYGKCPTFTKCASDPTGSWTLSGGCLSEDTFAEGKAKCPGLQESNVVLTASGTVVINALTVSRNSTTSLSATVAIPKACAQGATCAQVQQGLTLGLVPNVPKFDTAACKDSGANCDCDVTSSLTEQSNDAYTTAKDGDLTTTGGPNGDRTFEYCVDGNKLSYLETTANSLPFIVEMTKK